MEEQAEFKYSQEWFLRQSERVRKTLLARALLREWPSIVYNKRDLDCDYTDIKRRTLLFQAFRTTALFYISAAHDIGPEAARIAILQRERLGKARAQFASNSDKRQNDPLEMFAFAALQALSSTHEQCLALVNLAQVEEPYEPGGPMPVLSKQTIEDARESLRDPSLIFRPLWVPSRELDQKTSTMFKVMSGWELWKLWYEARLRGERSSIEADLAYLALPGSTMELEPELYNAYITKQLTPTDPTPDTAEDTSLPGPESVEPQELAGVAFATSDEQITLDSKFGAGNVAQDATHAELHFAVRECLEDLQSRLDPGTNFADHLRKATAKMIEALGTSPGELKPALAVLHANVLRSLRDVDLRRQATHDYDKAAMPEGVFGSLNAAVGSWNIYVASDEFLERIDSNRLGPDKPRPGGLGPKDIASAIISAERNEIATIDALETLRTIEELSQNTPLAAERALAFQLSAMRNFARAAFLLATKSFRLAKTVDRYAKTAMKVMEWVNKNKGWLEELFSDRPAVRELIEAIVRIFHSNP